VRQGVAPYAKRVEVPVSAVMTSPAVFVTLKRTVGVVSVGDLLRSIVETQGETISHLESYITGKYPG